MREMPMIKSSRMVSVYDQKGSTKSEDRSFRTSSTYLTLANEAGRAKVMAPPNRAWERTAVGRVGRFRWMR